MSWANAIARNCWAQFGLRTPDEEGRFHTWALAEGEPDVVPTFRVEADPVGHANATAYLGGRPETTDAQRWLEGLVAAGGLEGTSKWYPDLVAIYHAIARASFRILPARDRLRPVLGDRILAGRDANGDFGNILQTAQAVSALYNVRRLEGIDAKRHLERFSGSQREDGS